MAGPDGGGNGSAEIHGDVLRRADYPIVWSSQEDCWEIFSIGSWMSLKGIIRRILTSSSRLNMMEWRQLEKSQRHNSLTPSGKSIKCGDKVLGCSHPHPNPMKGVFSGLHFFASKIGCFWVDYSRAKSRQTVGNLSLIHI